MPYIYLVHCRACINANENIYKIGKSIDFNKRLSGYDKGTIPLLSIFVSECDNFERHLIRIFETRFTSRKDYGSEYFEGDITSMIKIIIEEYEKSKLEYTNQSTTIPMTDIIQTDNIIKIKKMLYTKLNKVNLKNINNFRNNIGLNSTELHMSQYYNLLYSIITQYISQTQIITPTSNKLKFGDYAENRFGFINNISFANDSPSIKLIERIKLSI